MTTPVLLTGGTGTLGREVLPRLLAAGHKVRLLSRRPDAGSDERHAGVRNVLGDLRRDDGLEAAVRGVATVVHLAGSSSRDDLTTARLVRFAETAGVSHLITMSVVGADRLPVRTRVDHAMFGYFAAKRAAEQVVSSSSVGWSTVRATQFHESLFALVQTLGRSPVVPVFAGFRFQPIAAGEVATRLVELVGSGPAGLVPELAGPRVYPMGGLVRAYLERAGRRRLVVAVPVPGPAARAYRAGANLAAEGAVGQQTWEDFLSARLG